MNSYGLEYEFGDFDECSEFIESERIKAFVVGVGEFGSGKKSIVSRFCRGKDVFEGEKYEHGSKNLTIDGTPVDLAISIGLYKKGGRIRYSQYSGYEIIFVTVNMACADDNFEQLAAKLSEIKQLARKDVLVVVVGTNMDYEDDDDDLVIDKNQLREFVQQQLPNTSCTRFVCAQNTTDAKKLFEGATKIYLRAQKQLDARCSDDDPSCAVDGSNELVYDGSHELVCKATKALADLNAHKIKLKAEQAYTSDQALTKEITAVTELHSTYSKVLNKFQSSGNVTPNEVLQAYKSTQDSYDVLTQSANSGLVRVIGNFVASIIAIVLLPIGMGFMINNAVKRGNPCKFFDSQGAEAVRELQSIAKEIGDTTLVMQM